MTSICKKLKTEVITDLCSTMASCDSASKYFGLLEGDEASFILQPATRNEKPHEMISLESLLRKNSDVTLNRRQRYTIALTLASSHLQLYPSPWIGLYWNKKDIIFARDPQNPQNISIDQPYILRDVISPAANPTSAYASTDRSLPTLGILLIELCFGTALEDHAIRQQCHSSSEQNTANPDLDAALDLAVALEWSRSVSGEAGEGYADAVHWCLRGQLADLRNDKWREELFANVVTPLQDCYEQLHPKSREAWLARN